MPFGFASSRLVLITIVPLLALIYLRTRSMMQIANPASEYCIQQGGTLEIVKDKAGNDIGMCKLPDGTVIEEWALFRSQQDKADFSQQSDQLDTGDDGRAQKLE